MNTKKIAQIALVLAFTTAISLTASFTRADVGNKGAWGDQGDGTFKNPVSPSDCSDIDCIRVGSDYYAISSTLHYSPGMWVLHSKDLVNWQPISHVVDDTTTISPEMNWDRMNRNGRGVWAGAIRYHAGKYWVYFGSPDEGYFVSTAKSPRGPWSPLTQVMKASGWDDCCPFWDDDGQGYLVGTYFKKDPNDGKSYNIHLFKLTPDGKGLVPGFDVILHQSSGSEASKLYKWNGLYYHYFSEVKQEGRVPMMGRAKNITGPYEDRQIGHVNARNDREPNQGGIVQAPNGSWWFLTHQGNGNWEGRTLSLLPVTWKDGWPIIGEIGPDGIGNMVWQAQKPIKSSQKKAKLFLDGFDDRRLSPIWEWHYQPRKDKWSLTERKGWLRLYAFKPIKQGNLLKAGNTLTQRIMNTGEGDAIIKLDVSHMTNGQAAGLCHYAGDYGWIGVTQTDGIRHITYSANGKQTLGPVVSSPYVWLRSTITNNADTTWSFSLDNKEFTPFGERYKFGWANYRGDRIGIFCYNDDTEAGYVDVDRFYYKWNN